MKKCIKFQLDIQSIQRYLGGNLVLYKFGTWPIVYKITSNFLINIGKNKF
jgi:hypothetical protein